VGLSRKLKIGIEDPLNSIYVEGTAALLNMLCALSRNNNEIYSTFSKSQDGIVGIVTSLQAG
jgi:hypothetical protein